MIANLCTLGTVGQLASAPFANRMSRDTCINSLPTKSKGVGWIQESSLLARRTKNESLRLDLSVKFKLCIVVLRNFAEVLRMTPLLPRMDFSPGQVP